MKEKKFPIAINFTAYYDERYTNDHKFWNNVDLWLETHIGELDIDWYYDHGSNFAKYERHIFYFKNEEDKMLFVLTWV